MRGGGSVFKFLRCKCGLQRRVKENQPQPKNPICTKCGKDAAYSEFWYVAYRKPDGKEAVYPVSPILAQARDELKRKMADLVDGKFSDRRRELPWPDAVKSFMAYKEATQRPGTVRFYRQHLDVMDALFKDYNISQITPQMLIDYIKRRTGKVTNTTINRDIVAVKTLLSTFVKGLILDEKGNKYLEHNVLDHFQLLPENDARTTIYTNEEIEKLLQNAAHPAVKPLILFGADAGLRKNTIVQMEKKFINWDLNRLEIPASRRKCGKYIHYVVMTSRLADSIKEWMSVMNEEQRESKYLFPAPENPETYFYSIEKPWVKTRKAAGLTEKRLHDLKHTAGTRMYEATNDIYATAAFLDHSDINMSKRYAHQLDDKRKAAMNKFENLIK